MGLHIKGAIKHFKTITKHRHAVIRHCFKAGIGWQGLFHDLSKYSYTEFSKGAKYYQGNRSPNEREREIYGYSVAWMHHKGRNRHHFEYWNDIDPLTKKYSSVPMPTNYLIEMFCDRVAASKIYKGKDYVDSHPYHYFYGGNAKLIMHPKTAEQLEDLLVTLKDYGEKEAFLKARCMLKEYKKENKNKIQ